MVEIVTLVGDDNQIYQALMIEGKPVRALVGNKLGTMTFTPLKNDEEEWADGPPAPGRIP